MTTTLPLLASLHEAAAWLRERGVATSVHWRPLHLHPYYSETFGWRPEDYPHAMKVGRQTVSLPLSPALTDQDVEDVVEAVEESLAGVAAAASAG